EDQLGQPRVEVVAAETGVAVRGQHLEDSTAELQDGDVEGAAPEVVDRDRPLLALVEPVGERRRGRLVHETQHLEAGEPPGVLARLALAVVAVGGHRDDGLGDGPAERVLGPALELARDVRRHLGRSPPRGRPRGCSLSRDQCRLSGPLTSPSADSTSPSSVRRYAISESRRLSSPSKPPPFNPAYRPERSSLSTRRRAASASRIRLTSSRSSGVGLVRSSPSPSCVP